MKTRIILFLCIVLALSVALSGSPIIDLNGVWRSNIGKTYEISQTRNIFTWKVPASSQTGSGNINGLKVSASWIEGGQRGSATGTVVLNPQGRAIRINWSNGVVFTRGEQAPPPSPERPPQDIGRPPQELPRDSDRLPQEGLPPEEGIHIGGGWFGSNGFVYEIAQHGRNFEFFASDGSKGSGKFIEEMRIQARFPDRRSVAGQVFMGPEPGSAAAIEWENGLVLTREQPAGRERPPEQEAPPRTEERLERAEQPPLFDISGLWFGSNRIEVEVGQEGTEFVWREQKTGKTSHGRVEGERMWMAAAGDERRQVEGQVLEADGRRATKVRWQDGTIFTRGEAPPAQEMLQVEKISPAQPEMKVFQAHLLKVKVYNTWVKMGGPVGGLGYDVRFSANTAAGCKIVYVTDNYSGVNMSQDGGATWSASNAGINARTGSSRDAIPVFSLTVDPNNPKIVWCGLKDVSGAYKSTDGGKTWVDVSPSKGGDFVFRGFTIMPGNSNIVFAAGEIPMKKQGKAFDRTRGRVYKTTNGGQKWSIIWEGENLARYVIVHPNDHNIIYISTGIFDREANNSDCKNPILDGSNLAASYAARGGLGVMKTEDGGKTWRALGRDKGLTDLYAGSLVMHPFNPNILLAGCGNNSASFYKQGGKTMGLGGVFLTTNGGEEWMNTLVGETITSVDFAWSNPKIAYACGQHTFYRSQDVGKTWTPMNGSPSQPWGPPGVVSGFPIDILVDPVNPNVVFVNNYGGGNVKSTDGGKSWTIASKGYTGALMFDVDMDLKNPDIVYSAARSGAFRSVDGGLDWQGLSFAPAVLGECYGIACQPGNSKIVLASQDRLGNLYWSQNGGLSWVKVYKLASTVAGDPKKEFGFKRIVFAPSNPQIVYAGSCRTDTALNTISKSGLGIFKSTDGGKTWAEANNGLTKNLSVNNLAVHPQNPNIVYAATVSGGLCKTTNGGTNWVRLGGLKPNDVRSVALRPDQPDTIYAGIKEGGIYYSANGGATWTAMAAGMEPNDSIYALVIDPVHPDAVWAGSNKTGVYRHDSIEQQWVHFNTGLRTRAVMDLAISGDGRVLYAATWGEGVFRLDLKPYGTK
jgi:photosystem II stability/assembly factor-like uncharacterized protein